MLALLVACSLSPLLVAIAAPLGGAPAHAETTPASTLKTKVVKIGAKQFPKLLDRPGNGNDTIILTKIAGVDWIIGGDTEPVKFDGSAKTTPRDVTGDTTITAEAAAGTTTNTFVVNGPTSFTYKPTNTPATYSDAELMSFLTFVDMPGTKGDSVTMTKAEGVHWKIGTVTYDEAKFGAKTSVTAKLNAGVKVFPIAVGATLSDADGAVAVGFNGVTDAARSSTRPISSRRLWSLATTRSTPRRASARVPRWRR